MFFIFFSFSSLQCPRQQCSKQKWCMLFFTSINLIVCVLACARVIACFKWRRLSVWRYYVTSRNLDFHFISKIHFQQWNRKWFTASWWSLTSSRSFTNFQSATDSFKITTLILLTDFSFLQTCNKLRDSQLGMLLDTVHMLVQHLWDI